MSPLYHAIQLPLFVPSKVCPRCNPPVAKPLECFTKNKSTKDGYCFYCKDCSQAYERARRAANPESFREQDRKRVRDREKMRTYSRDHYERNGNRKRWNAVARERYANDPETREKRRIWGEKYRQARAEHRRQKHHEYYLAHKMEAKEKDMRRNALKKSGKAEKVSYSRILERDGRWCHICGQAILPHHVLNFDHVVPLIRGGAHSETNIKPSHRVCNYRKHDMLMEELTTWHRRGPDA